MKNICILFGGKSSEYFVSCKSAYTIIKNIPCDKYNVITVGISRDGDWYLYEDSIELLTDATWENTTKKSPASFLLNSRFPGLTVFRENSVEHLQVDVVFPVLHGKNGEDGTVQGLLDMIEIPYVGCGLLSSAVSMDKSYTKIAVDTLGIKQAPYVLLTTKNTDDWNELIDKAVKEFGYPLFVKPCKAGSSCGVSKAHNSEELMTSVDSAFLHDSKVLIEKAIFGRELECAILETNEIIPSKVGEIITANGFYSYDAKYIDITSKTDTAPILPDGIEDKIRQAACKIFRVLDCRSLSRVDFFLENGTNEIIFNEINTLPGFTNISMYPMLMNGVGYSIPELLCALIETAHSEN